MLLFHRSNWCDGPCDNWKACMLFVVTVKGWLKMRDPGCERNHVWLYPNMFLHISCPVSSGLTAGWELWAGYGKVGVAGQNRDWARQTQWGSIPNYKLSIIQSEVKLGTWCTRAPQDKTYYPVFIEAFRVLLIFNTMSVSHLPQRLYQHSWSSGGRIMQLKSTKHSGNAGITS